MVPLGTLVKVREDTGPIFVRRYNLYTAAPITGALLPGVSSGDVINAVDKIAEETLPLSMKAEWTELMFMQIKEGNTTGIVFCLAVVCVFLALAALYESWTLPLAVILVVPLVRALFVDGVLVGDLLEQDTSVNIFVQIGLVVLVGLACKNAILVVEFAKELHMRGKSVYDGHPGVVAAAAAAHPDDVVRVHSGRGAVVPRLGGRGGDAQVARHRGLQRHARRDDVRHLPDAGVLLRHPGHRREPAVRRRDRAMGRRRSRLGGGLGGTSGYLLGRSWPSFRAFWAHDHRRLCGGVLASWRCAASHREVNCRGAQYGTLPLASARERWHMSSLALSHGTSTDALTCFHASSSIGRSSPR